MKQILVVLGVGIWLGLVGMGGVGRVEAAEFETSYVTTYEVEEDGLVRVRLQVAIRNAVSNVFVEKFFLGVGLTDVAEVEVRDGSGRLVPSVEREENKTKISFEFGERVVGKDKVNEFEVRYETRDVAVNNGAVWEISIPVLTTGGVIDEQRVIVIVPKSLGKASLATPRPVKEEVGRLEFAGEAVKSSPITIWFGDEQWLRFGLRYSLENRGPLRGRMEIALPPDTNYQKMMYEEIVPWPRR